MGGRRELAAAELGSVVVNFHRLFFLMSRQEVLSRAFHGFVTVFWFNDFESGPPLKLVKYLPHNCDLSSVFIRGNRLICVFKSFVPKNESNDNLGVSYYLNLKIVSIVY